MVNAFNLYFADLQPALKNRPHLLHDDASDPRQCRKTNDPPPHAQGISPLREEFLPTRLLPLIRHLTRTRTLPLVPPRADFSHRSLTEQQPHRAPPPLPDKRSRPAARTRADSRIRSVSSS